MSSDADPHRPGWHDRDVANAADAWLHEPRDTQAYQRLIDAIARRRHWLSPTLGFAATNEPDPATTIDPELLDALADARPPTRLSSAIETYRLTISRAAPHPHPDTDDTDDTADSSGPDKSDTS